MSTVTKDNFSALPKERPSRWPIGEARMLEGDEGHFDWVTLVSLYVHPVKVAIIEALIWIGQPLSSTELAQLLGIRNYSLGVVAYHVNQLAKRGVIEPAYERQVRGARESFYFFPET